MPLTNFILLDVTAHPDKTIEIIKAVGDTWPFLLTVSGVVFLIVNKKQIGAFLSNFRKISGKTPVGEITFENLGAAVAATQEVIAPKADPNKNQEVDKLIEDKNGDNEDHPWLQVYNSLKSKSIVQADSIFEKIQNAETSSSQRERNYLMLQYFKYVYAGIDTLNELKAKAKSSTSNLIKFYCYEYLAMCYWEVKKYDECLTYRQMSYDLAPDEEHKALTARQISLCLYELGRKTEAIEYLKGIKQGTPADAQKKIIYETLAELYDKDQNWVLKSIANEMALSCSPNNISLLFDTAFAYTNSYKSSIEQIPSLALLHYKELIQYDNKSQGGYNNLGVALSSFGLEGLAIENYKKSAELGNTLAASNLSSRFMHTGFYQEAKKILLKAKESDDIHENVWKILENLSRKEKEEAAKYTSLLEKANEEQKFLRKFGEAFFSPSIQPSFLGDWLCDLTPVQIRQLPNPLYSEFKWAAKDINFTISIPTSQRNVISESGSCFPKGGGISEKILAFVTDNTEQQTISLLVYILSEPSKSHFFSFAKAQKEDTSPSNS